MQIFLDLENENEVKVSAWEVLYHVVGKDMVLEENQVCAGWSKKGKGKEGEVEWKEMMSYVEFEVPVSRTYEFGTQKRDPGHE